MALSFIRLAVYLKKKAAIYHPPFFVNVQRLFFLDMIKPPACTTLLLQFTYDKVSYKTGLSQKKLLSKKFHRMHHTLKDGCILDSFIDFERRILATLQKGDTGAERGFAVLYSYLADVFKFKRVSWGNPTWDLGTKLYPACNLLVADKGTTSMPL